MTDATSHVSQQPVYSLGERGRHPIRERPRRLQPFHLFRKNGSRRHQDAPRSYALRQFNIAGMVPDQIRPREIDSLLVYGSIDQAAIGFPAITPVIGMVWADVNGIEHNSGFTEEVSQLRVNTVKIAGREESPRNPRLIGHHDQPRAGLFQPGQSLRYTGK